MKWKPKGKIAAVLIALAALAAVIAAQYLGFATTRSALRVGYVGSAGPDGWSAGYVLLDGAMRHRIHPEGDTLHIEARTDGGSLSVRVEDEEGGVLFEEEDLGGASYDVPVTGPVWVRLEGDRHKGGFRIFS